MNEYSNCKLAAYPETLKVLQQKRAPADRLLSVHLMPQNVCNQSCEFCSYRMPGNKNSEVFDESAHIPLYEMESLLADFAELGVQGVEVTGGGEPLAYPHTDALWERLAEYGFATALVTNGTLMRGRAPNICASRLKWARVSIDCANRKTYSRMRLAPERHFDLAWSAVRQLREFAPDDPEFRLGVGFVLSNENRGEVYDFVRLAKDHGADNVRLSVTYSDDHEKWFNEPGTVASDLLLAEKAVADFGDKDFTVHNLMETRWKEVLNPFQGYGRCTIQEILCVVEGTGKVYTCCTFTGSEKGNQGVFWDHPEGFKGLWGAKAPWRAKLDPRTYCTNSCLYEKRNKEIIKLLQEPPDGKVDVIHREFV